MRSCARARSTGTSSNACGRIGSVASDQRSSRSSYACGGASSTRCPMHQVTTSRSPAMQPLPPPRMPSAAAIERAIEGFSATITLTVHTVRAAWSLSPVTLNEHTAPRAPVVAVTY
jgi:hypothetical protein